MSFKPLGVSLINTFNSKILNKGDVKNTIKLIDAYLYTSLNLDTLKNKHVILNTRFMLSIFTNIWDYYYE